MWSCDSKKCFRCGACVGVCPRLALEINLNGLQNDKNLCTLCGLCEKVCPVGAITVDKGKDVT